MRTLITLPLPSAHSRRRITATRALAARALRRSLTTVTIASGLLLAGCAAAPQPTTGPDHASDVEHVHAIVPSPSEDGFLLGTHDGIYPATASGELGPRINNVDFDAMGLTTTGDILIASGHPGPTTPAELGSPNLGIIRSDDSAQTWTPVTFTGEKDFHVLTASPDGTLYGIASDSIELLRSDDTGNTWTPVGDGILAFSLVVDNAGQLIAATPDGLQISEDEGETFTASVDSPPLYLLAASPDGTRQVGVGRGEQIWARSTAAGEWTEAGVTHGTAQAITITNGGDLLVFDDSGLTAIPAM